MPEPDSRMIDYLVILNADAGSADSDTLADAVAILRERGSVEVVSTSAPAELDAAVRRATGTVVVAGGDGSLHAVINAVVRAAVEVPVGLIPLGTGNDFAQGVGVPLDPEAAARLIVDRDPRPIDLLRAADGSVVVNNVHLGVGAQASQVARPVKGVLGRLAYAAGALIAGARPAFLRVRVRVDGEVVVLPDEDVAQVALAKGPLVGGGAEIAPDADPTDGLIHIVISRAVGTASRARYLIDLRRGRHGERPDVDRLVGRFVEVEGKPFDLSSDGELSGPHTSASWRLERAALLMHVGDVP